MHILLRVNKGIFPRLRDAYEVASPEDKKKINKHVWKLPFITAILMLKAVIVMPVAILISIHQWLEPLLERTYDVLHPWLHKGPRKHLEERRLLIVKYQEAII